MQEKTEEYRKHEGIAALIFFSFNDYRTQMGEDGTGRLRQRVHGTTDLYGEPKPSYQALRELGAPITVKRGLYGSQSLVERCLDGPRRHTESRDQRLYAKAGPCERKQRVFDSFAVPRRGMALRITSQ
ncbi:hypothetical protein PAEN110709_08455 [Paenibacillus endophyticus]